MSTFVGMGFMTKIDDNDEDMNVEVAEDNDMFNEDSNKSESLSSKHSSCKTVFIRIFSFFYIRNSN